MCLVDVFVVWLWDFLEIYWVLVVVGEEFGDLVQVMECLVDYIEECNVLCGKIFIVFIYLVVVGVVFIGIVIFFFGYVVLQVVSVFFQVCQDLLVLIWVMFQVSDFVCVWGWFCVGVIGSVYWGWCLYLCDLQVWFGWYW